MPMEQIEVETNPEVEMKIAKRAELTGESRSEIIVSALISFLSSLGF